MNFWNKRTPLTKIIKPTDSLVDSDISNYKEIISNLKNSDFPIKKEFDDAKAIISLQNIPLLQLCKLLYCTSHRKELFLYLGVIIESKLNEVAQLYISNHWISPRGYVSEEALHLKLNEFKKKCTLSDKANMIFTYDLFNHLDTSEQIKHKLQAFRFLRNYGGHSKSVNEFLETIIDSQPECDNEILDAFRLLHLIDIATKNLQSTPPAIIT